MQEKRELQKDVEKDLIEIASLTKQLAALRGGLQGITDADKELLAAHDKYLEEEQFVEVFERNLVRTRDAAQRFLADLSHPSPTNGELVDSPNEVLLTHLVMAHRLIINDVFYIAQKAIDIVNSVYQPDNPFRLLHKEWKAAFDSHCEKYEAAKQKAKSQQIVLAQIQEIESRIKSLRSTLAEKRERLSKLGNPEEEYAVCRSEWSELQEQRAHLLKEKCLELTKLSSGRISASIDRGYCVAKIQERLVALMVGTKIRSKRYDDLFALVTGSENPPEMWEKVLIELEKVASAVSNDKSSVELPHTPLLASAGYTRFELEKVARKLTPQEWLELSLLELEDQPVFLYEQKEDEYIRFEDASAGQQATALLRVLLNQEGPPLLIDQPEEDLDNQIILDIVEEIWTAKKKRQLIFTSHNANIVVNGDADLVVCCDYRTAGDQSGGRLKLQGAIDIPEMKKEITVVMEGGREAFRLRRDKYGF
jgi:AAA domain, putative AbiEii toxin, Type IV TA system